MSKPRGARIGANAAEMAAGSSALYFVAASPDPNGNRAQRRAWAKAAKQKMPAAPAETPEANR